MSGAVLPYLKAYAALLGSLATALLTVYTDSEALTVLAIVATTFGTWVVPNLDPAATHQDESVQPPDGVD